MIKHWCLFDTVYFLIVDANEKPVHVVDRFCAAVVLTPSSEVLKRGQDEIVRVPATSRLVSGSPDGTLLGADRKKVK